MQKFRCFVLSLTNTNIFTARTKIQAHVYDACTLQYNHLTGNHVFVQKKYTVFINLKFSNFY